MHKKQIHISIGLRILAFFTLTLISIGVLIVFPIANHFRKESDLNLKKLENKQLEAIEDRLQTIMDNYQLLTNMTFMKWEVQRDILYGKEATKTNTIHNNLITMMINSKFIQNNAFISNKKVYVSTLVGRQYKVNSDILDKNYDVLAQKENTVKYNTQMQKYLEFEPYFDSFTFHISVNSLYDYENIGILLFNVDKNKLYQNIFNNDDKVNFFIFNEDGNIILNSQNSNSKNINLAIDCYKQTNDFKIIQKDMQVTTLSKYKSNLFGWTFISVSSNNQSNLSQFFKRAGFSVLFIAFIFLLCHLYITINIIKPIKKLQKNMIKVRKQEFEAVAVKNTKFTSEITDLQFIFNDMIVKIMRLKDDIREKETLKRRHEILLLQEQIKPHFLYNTLDGISALNLVGDNKLAYELTAALSGFYRTSLSNAHIFIPIKSELDCVQNYIKILQIRYKNCFESILEIENALLELEIPKFIMQPIVENAIKHGLIVKKSNGLLKITGKFNENYIVFCIEDNGVGISSEKILEIQQGKFDKGGSFGLYNVFQKLSLYGAEKPVRIESKLGEYTRVYLYIPHIIKDEKTNLERVDI